jgi:hypothetical protein
MSDLKPVKISGELFWSKWMAEFNKAFNADNDRYECTIGNISDADVAKLTGLGIRVKYKDSQGNYIVVKSKFLFKPTDADGNTVAVDALGNGSKCEALVTAYKHKMSAKFGLSPSIVGNSEKTALKVTEVKTYVPDAKQEDDDLI